MATFKSKQYSVKSSAADVYAKLSDFESLGKILAGQSLDAVPADKREMLEKVRITPDSISFPAGPVGEITMVKGNCVAPTLITLAGQGTPVPVNMNMHITPETADSCQVEVEFDLAIPAMLKPMVSGPIQNMLNQTGELIGRFSF